MIDVTKATYLDRWDNDERRCTEMYFSLPTELTAKLVQTDYAKQYHAALATNQVQGTVTPYMELQCSCPYGESMEQLGSVELGIGIENVNGIEVLDLVNLIPEQDFSIKDVTALWKQGIEQSQNKNFAMEELEDRE